MNPEYLRLIGDHLWQSTLFAGVAGLVTLALRKNRARVRHAVWLVASCKFLLPFSVLVALSAHIPWRTAPLTIASPVSIALGGAGHPFTGPVFESTVLPMHPPAHPLPSFLFGTWLCGFIGIALSWWVRWRRVRAAAHGGTPVHLDITIRAVSSRSTIQPGVFGILRPVLLLPEDIFHRLTPAQLSAVIAHELCHVRHRDNLMAAVHMFVETVFWFYPLVWWIGKRMVAERERACDEEVLRLGSEPNVYAEGILRVCASYVDSPLAWLSGVTGSDLKKRIEAIVAGRRAVDLSFANKAVLTLLGVLCLALPVITGIWNATPLRAQSEVSVLLSPPPSVKFHSVSIERCKNYRPGEMGSPTPGRLVANCLTTASLIRKAWLKPMTGESEADPLIPLAFDPVWVGSGNYRYRIDARADPGTSLATMEGQMLQSLLADRFALKVRRVTRESPMYALVVAANGAPLQRSNERSCTGAWLRDGRFGQAAVPSELHGVRRPRSTIRGTGRRGH
jgi:bla regulator protein BlaR1